MLLLQVFTMAVLALIFLQDLKGRAVYWFLFPVLAAALILIRFAGPLDVPDLIRSVLINLAFIAIQMAVLTGYFSLKSGGWVNITARLLGWGDILFLGCMALYLPVLNFLFFYIVSLIVVLLGWFAWQLFSANKDQHIPLAGLQSLMVIVLLAGDWWCRSFNLADDAWLLNLVAK
jgi:hypothetical protein